MAAQEFGKLYYRTANCLTSDIIADFAPVSRVMGVDTSSGMGVVFTAMGTRFDMQYVAKEAYTATDSYEADTRSIDDTPVADVMRYARSEIIAGDKVPEQYKSLTDSVLSGECVYNSYKEYETGDETAQVLFVISPAAPDAAKTSAQFISLAGKAGKTAFCTNKYKDCGYLLLQFGQMKAANALAEKIKADVQKYDEIVTDDSYVLDALLVLCPELASKIKFIDEFIYSSKAVLGEKAEKVVLHESGIIQRLYPNRKVDYKEVLPKADIIVPVRSGYDVTDSGLAGGLGLAEPGVLLAVAARRMMDLTAEEHDVIVTPCACEAVGLNCAEAENVVTLLDYICG